MILARRVVTSIIILVATTFTSVYADPISVEAFDNATVRPSGPRAPTSGKNYFNIEGSVNGSFASYGVADFDFGALPNTVLSVNSIELQITQSNAVFSLTGLVVFSLDKSSPLADIQSGTSPLAYDGADPGTATDVSDGDLDLLALGGGPFSYTVGANGDVDSYNFTFDAATETELVTRLNGGYPIRIVIGTGQNDVAATWAGFSNTTYDGPTLNLDVKFDTSTAAGATSWGRVKALYR